MSPDLQIGMIMTPSEKVFEAIADAINDAYTNEELTDEQRFAIRFVASNVAYAIDSTSGNPRFNQSRFIKAATLSQ